MERKLKYKIVSNTEKLSERGKRFSSRSVCACVCAKRQERRMDPEGWEEEGDDLEKEDGISCAQKLEGDMRIVGMVLLLTVQILRWGGIYSD